MVNSSLAYEILLYINSFYFGLFATCELGTLILKSALIIEKYDGGLAKIGQDYGVLLGLCVIELARLIMGRRGSLTDKGSDLFFVCFWSVLYINFNWLTIGWFIRVKKPPISLYGQYIPVLFSVVLTVPSIIGVFYLVYWQVVVLKIEYIWCTLMLTLQGLEFMFACMFIVSMFRGPSYD